MEQEATRPQQQAGGTKRVGDSPGATASSATPDSAQHKDKLPRDVPGAGKGVGNPRPTIRILEAPTAASLTNLPGGRRAAEKTRDAMQRTDEWAEQTAAAAGREGGEGETAGVGAEVAAAAAGPGVEAASRESAAPTAGSKRNREEVQGAQGGEGRETAGPSGSAEARAAPAAPARGEQIVIGNKRAGKQRALRQQGVYEGIQIGRGTVFGNMFAMRKGGNDRKPQRGMRRI